MIYCMLALAHGQPRLRAASQAQVLVSNRKVLTWQELALINGNDIVMPGSIVDLLASGHRVRGQLHLVVCRHCVRAAIPGVPLWPP